MRYSPTTRTFYGDAVDVFPEDAYEVSDDERAALLVASEPQIPRADLESAAWERIQAERDRRTQTAGFHVGAYWFHSDTFSRSQQLGLVLNGAALPAGIQWKTMSGEVVLMTPALAQQILAAGTLSDVAVFTAAETHHAAMQASADPAAYDFIGGWPPAFGDLA